MLCSSCVVCERGTAVQANGARRPVSRVLSASVLDTGRPFLWDAPHGAPHATNPDGEAGMPPGLRRALAGAAVPIRSCSRWGLPCRPCCQGRGALLPHRFALARGVPHRDAPRGAMRSLRGRFVFCGTVPGVAPAGGWPAPHSRGARTFLCRLAATAAVRPSGTERDARAGMGRQAGMAAAGCCQPSPAGGRYGEETRKKVFLSRVEERRGAA
jgi:hypothetical protein